MDTLTSSDYEKLASILDPDLSDVASDVPLVRLINMKTCSQDLDFSLQFSYSVGAEGSAGSAGAGAGFGPSGEARAGAGVDVNSQC